METLGEFKFKVVRDSEKLGWSYKIYGKDGTILISDSPDVFESEGVARYAAIGHITILERNSSSQCEHF